MAVPAASSLPNSNISRLGETSTPTPERIRQMLAASPAIIYTTKATGDYSCTFVSENLRAIFGFTPEEMIVDPKHWPANLHPQDASRVIDKVSALIEQGGGVLEYRFRHHDGHYLWIQDTFRVLPKRRGRARGTRRSLGRHIRAQAGTGSAPKIIRGAGKKDRQTDR